VPNIENQNPLNRKKRSSTTTLDEWCTEVITITAIRLNCRLSKEQEASLRTAYDSTMIENQNACSKVMKALSEEVFARAERKETFGPESRLAGQILYGTP
jgi:hypothetical protein